MRNHSINHFAGRFLHLVVMCSVAGLLIFHGAGCSGVDVTHKGCENCPDRCILTPGGTRKCVQCTKDKQCQTSSTPSAECRNNKCTCGQDHDCEGDKHCDAQKGCVECVQDAHCKNNTAQFCINSRCAVCRPTDEKECQPDETKVCVKGKKTCDDSGAWGDCKGWKICKPTERCDANDCVPKCEKAPECKEASKACITTKDIVPGQYKVCEKDKNGCLTWSGTKSCKSGEHCEKGSCIPFSCPKPPCTENQRQCVDAQNFQVCQKDQQGCLRWSKQQACPTGEVCQSTTGSCQKQSCKSCGECETCVNGKCQPKTDDVACKDDGNPCTLDACKAGKCEHPPKVDGFTCKAGFICLKGQCVVKSCSPACGECAICSQGQCLPKANGLGCTDDGKICTLDLCDAGKCVHRNKLDGTTCGSGKVCENGVCSIPTCKPACGECQQCTNGSCQPKPANTPCKDDGKICTRDICIQGVCSHPNQKNGTTCGSGKVCTSGVCGCPPGMTDCGGQCVDLKSNRSHCGQCNIGCAANDQCNQGKCGAPCSSPNKVCFGKCVNVQTNASYCGDCSTRCNTGRICRNARCSCPSNTKDCVTHCADTLTDPKNCGSCNQACGSGQTCSNGSCACLQSGLTACGGSCVDVTKSDAHCGKCFNRCPYRGSCNAGTCQCPSSYSTNCNQRCVDLKSDASNCGSCGNRCPSGQRCVQGRCGSCNYSYCGSTCVNLQTDSNNCGSCGNRCPSGQQCSSGKCSCPSGFKPCNNSCISASKCCTNSDCSGGRSCQNGTCVCPFRQFYHQNRCQPLLHLKRWHCNWSSPGNTDWEHIYSTYTPTVRNQSGRSCPGSGFLADTREIWIYPLSIGSGSVAYIEGRYAVARLMHCRLASTTWSIYIIEGSSEYNSVRYSWSCNAVGYVITSSGVAATLNAKKIYRHALPGKSTHFWSSISNEAGSLGATHSLAWWAPDAR